MLVGRTRLLGCVWFPARPNGAGADCSGDGWSLAEVLLAGLSSHGSGCRKSAISRVGCSPEVSPGDARLWIESLPRQNSPAWAAVPTGGRGVGDVSSSAGPSPPSPLCSAKRFSYLDPFFPLSKYLVPPCMGAVLFSFSLSVSMVLLCESSSPAPLTANKTARAWFCRAGERQCCSHPLSPRPRCFAWVLHGHWGSCSGAFAELSSKAAAAGRAAAHLENCWEWKLLMQALWKPVQTKGRGWEQAQVCTPEGDHPIWTVISILEVILSMP